MKKVLSIVAVALLSLSGCAEMEASIRAERAQREAKRQQAIEAENEAIKASVQSTCAYAQSDQIRYGDCVRQELNLYFANKNQRQQLEYMQSQQQFNNGLLMLQQAQPRPAPMQPPLDVRCQTRYNNGVAYTNCN